MKADNIVHPLLSADGTVQSLERRCYSYSFTFRCDDHSRPSFTQSRRRNRRGLAQTTSSLRHMTLPDPALPNRPPPLPYLLPISLPRMIWRICTQDSRLKSVWKDCRKAVLIREMGGDRFWREAREYVSLGGQRKRELKKVLWPWRQEGWRGDLLRVLLEGVRSHQNRNLWRTSMMVRTTDIAER